MGEEHIVGVSCYDSRHRAGFVIAGIFFANMDTVTAGLFGNVGAVIEDQRNVAVVTHRQDGIDRLADVIIADIFQTKLQAINRTGIKNRLQRLAKGCKFDFRRGQKIKTGKFVSVHGDNS
eukprot:NODE_4721_length_757_cov_1.852381_g4698_i0.p1 GENE.NODE_4721_length_757_cov_1.852381_g4698_i0~~NODE_4721_length_757_cov_1.852381_g4698_i0.p1  ORF type:complete len:136 (+),score=19.12 NODE_4721_length_757_cov_1.852381_g4698_i0:50-409(+)